MPIYDYQCSDCGIFSELIAMDKSDLAQPCPNCGASAKRVLVKAPMILAMSQSKRFAHATNEKAQNEPKRSSQHPAGCGCCKPVSSKSLAGGKSNVQIGLSGSKSFPQQRPWMISH